MYEYTIFLSEQEIKFGTYALVNYDNKELAVWFTSHGGWFLESPCELYKEAEIKNKQELRDYVSDMMIEDGDVDLDEHIKDCYEHMLVNGILYEIENFQCAPFLPEEVDSIKIISEKDCLRYLLSKSKN